VSGDAGTTELGRLIARRIALTGPISLADFMAEALGHPRLGYYRKRMPIGATGDFVTAPEVSQMFGELIGAWLAERWQALGSPDPVNLAELGPGRGALLADALRATRSVPGFHAALRLHLVDINETLRAEQAQSLAAYHPTWHERLDGVPEGPLLLVANEFFDALPVRQFHKSDAGWRERMVGLDPDGEALALALAPGPTPYAPVLPSGPTGAEAELSPAALALMAEIATRLVRDAGWALIVDYGRDEPGLGASLQAVRANQLAKILDRPGETDLSAHVDFASLAGAARGAGANVFGPTGQGEFLVRIGIERRAAALKARATAMQQQEIDRALARLIAPDQMGTLFRVLAVGDGRTESPAGFSDPR
jgi:NADH dehydrogenase [ubiquinone] 1 alpha subcomplex assembly factor 7